MAGACKGTFVLNGVRVDYEYAVKGPQNAETILKLMFNKVPVEAHFAFLAQLYVTHYIANDFGIRLSLETDKPKLPPVQDEQECGSGEEN